MGNRIAKIYSMVYDNPKYGNNGFGNYLGEFEVLKQLREDAWVDDFIGINVETRERCIILSTEVKGYGGGIRYRVIPVTDCELSITGNMDFAEWVMAVDDFEDGKDDRELPHCSKCNRGVYIHDAGSWCPFCGCLMKNPMRE